MYRQKPSDVVAAGARVPAAMIVPLVILAAVVVAFGVWPALAGGLTGPAGRVVLDIFSRQGGM
jgi:formate hydrogenlyase subunit 3/multisubunit Na+/H+ antiporter MnhD subunit